MLTLKLKHGEKLFINGQEIIITIKDSNHKSASIGIEADRSIPIVRESALLRDEVELAAES